MPRRLSFASLIACMFAIGWTSIASASPVNYALNFDATSGPSGTGAFVFDIDTKSMTGFSWDFGGTNTGGFADNLLAGLDPFGNKNGAVLFQLITGTPVISFHPLNDEVQTNFNTWPDEVIFDDVGGYIFNVFVSGAFQLASQGHVTATPTAAAPVPEPMPLAMFVLGAGLLGAVRFGRRFANRAG